MSLPSRPIDDGYDSPFEAEVWRMHARQQRELAKTIPAPERPDTEDAYLRCTKCGWAYPIETTLADEACSQCEGHLVYAVGEWNG